MFNTLHRVCTGQAQCMCEQSRKPQMQFVNPLYTGGKSPSGGWHAVCGICGCHIRATIGVWLITPTANPDHGV
eukprot:NODE_2493_length_687_cov_65.465517_g2039_i0.p2 GENE.NODE_2493_length_687_cov_65.465517_g2039_i0~~NODE_2493_length_687_cov_65.465517_g2039_i0.p2  ORF type:complete len:73 (-),score=10.88 NODE_2493_length_687_cov_65.465517_g2039_i0:411-629(-)